MEATIGKFFESVSSFFGGGDQIPWCDRDVIAGCEREVAEADESASEERKNESIMRLSWALVHSRQSEDINRGMAMLEASLTNSKTPLQQREKLYLLTVGYYRSGEYSRSRQLLDQCLEIAPDWRQALTLKKTVEEQIAKDGVIGIGITATALGLVAAGVAAAVTRR
ncbi:mitochondrial fission 1 protein A [Momordica charantia]|uniref:Mitochondrial fission 1 protein n=1 Tax=Momordica charantia TaxID=3673 RepID=A0A6J1DI31_MOMCH|nr:mitochondrial fission 1 protein A [Momordica charantia]